ncbi:MAG: hypothetical protein RJB13_503 [Pseudomonadota bacterium]|jgi:HAD superfamily hydrolase (TIGR01509 family)
MQEFIQSVKSAKCFLWDFDGCFADTEKLHFIAYSEAFVQFGHELNEAEYYPSFTHLGDGTKREIALRCPSVPEQEVLQIKAEAYRKLINEARVTCFPETRLLVQKMKQLGAKVAIASNSSEEEIRTVLKRSDFPVEMLDVIVGKSPNLRKKPAPDIFFHALSLLGLQSHDAIVLEDSNRGLQAAAAAGCLSVWVKTKYNTGLETKEPHLAALTHGQLLELLNSVPS